MTQRYITEHGVKYRIRGPYTASDLRRLFPKVIAAYPGTKLTFKDWLVRYGKVYNKVR
jgi:hypothetical protein